MNICLVLFITQLWTCMSTESLLIGSKTLCKITPYYTCPMSNFKADNKLDVFQMMKLVFDMTEDMCKNEELLLFLPCCFQKFIPESSKHKVI